MENYKGRGEHSVNELETLIEEREEKINELQSQIQMYNFLTSKL